MSFETIRIDRDDRGVATLTLAQPEKHNAMSARMIDELTEATEILGQIQECIINKKHSENADTSTSVTFDLEL